MCSFVRPSLDLAKKGAWKAFIMQETAGRSWSRRQPSASTRMDGLRPGSDVIENCGNMLESIQGYRSFQTG